MYKELDTPEGEKNMYRIAKARDKACKDSTHIKQIKSNEGKVLKDNDDIRMRWKDYFNTLVNEENPRPVRIESEINQGVVFERSH